MAEEERCLFCKIAQGKDEKTTLVYQVYLCIVINKLKT